MSYKFTKGSTVQGDIKAADDTQRDTLIDFGEDQIDLQTSGSTRVSVTNTGATINGTLFVDSEDASTNEGIRFRKTGQQYRQIVFESDSTNAAQIQLDNGEQLNIDQLQSSKEIRLRIIGGGNTHLAVSSNGVKIGDSYLLPTSDGSDGQILQTNGSGQLSFVDDNEVAKFGSGTLTTGKLYYLNGSAWAETDADAPATGADQLLGIALGSSPTSDGLLLRGFFDASSYLSNFSGGKAVYISTTAGGMDTTQPSGTGDFVRIVGYCTSTADMIYFNPSSTWIEL